MLGGFEDTPAIMHDVGKLVNKDAQTKTEDAIGFPIPNMINEKRVC